MSRYIILNILVLIPTLTIYQTLRNNNNSELIFLEDNFGETRSQCHPKCRWVIENSDSCRVVNIFSCSGGSNCEVKCLNLETIPCKTECKKPNCKVNCLKYQKGSSKPLCETLCSPLECQTICEDPPQPQCDIYCEEIVCNQQCTKGYCPKDVKLVCEHSECLPEINCKYCDTWNSEEKILMPFQIFIDEEKNKECCRNSVWRFPGQKNNIGKLGVYASYSIGRNEFKKEKAIIQA
jgi:hypothetical protein